MELKWKKQGRLLILDAEQNTPEWGFARAGILTSSTSTFKVTKKTGEPTAASKVLTIKKAAERLTGTTEQISSKYFAHGHEKEPKAIHYYESRTGHFVQKLGFAKLAEYPYIGDSPDGLVGYDETTGRADIVIEVKSHVAPVKFGDVLLRQHPDYSEYLEQILHHFLVFDCEELHHISYVEKWDGEVMCFFSVLKRPEFESMIHEHFENLKLAEIEIQQYHRTMQENLIINTNNNFL